MKKGDFTSFLMRWHIEDNRREMPWKGEKDPYKVWLSEVILQQTRVEQGWAYFERFCTQYPDIQSLALAKDEEVFKLWEGLGYYSRCKNLLATARTVHLQYQGIFPDDYETILSLKGVGGYTAAAISSFCFNLPYPVVDGNVLRVLARVFAIQTPIDSHSAKKEFTTLASKLLDKENPGAFNQAMMDLGATICKPASPLCDACPLQTICLAYKTGKVSSLPFKEKKLKRRTRWFTYFVFENSGLILVKKRTARDIWQNLFEFYLAETEDDPHWDEQKTKNWLASQLKITKLVDVNILKAESQSLTHQDIKGYFIKVSLAKIPGNLKPGENHWVNTSYMATLAFPRFINQYLEQNCRQLKLFNC